MQPGDHLTQRADAPAVVMGGSGEVVTYAQLDARSKQLAQLLRAAGLGTGDHVALLLENHPRYFEAFWATQRAGLYVTPINWHLTPDEAGYIIEDCGATALITSAQLADVASRLEPHLGAVRTRLMITGDVDSAVSGYDRYEDAIAAFPAEPLPTELEGSIMFYSSGTTGRPKGILAPLSGERFGESDGRMLGLIQFMYGMTPESVYLCPAPLYHAAPLGWSTAVQRMGGTVVVMARFDPVDVLRLIERHRVTHAQFVPTHFIRMLKLPAGEREAYDLSSLQYAIHAAAPCPVDVKRAMIDWWGPRIHEYYAGSEGNGFCAIGPEDWLAHPGSVGKPLIGELHICDDDGEELPVGEAGQIWFDSGSRFEYHNDPDKTASAFNQQGWSSLGDIGYVDDEGFLYLTDRVSHMIISGGVNIYPQEVENLLALHPDVVDVAVIGVPNADMGEEVKAVIIPADPTAAGPELAASLIDHCREHLAHYKCPASVDFVDELPRLPTGKLLKRQLRSRYWG
ncbi:MAG: acyl-CoA synthetase [Acidimicrobiales bacterium]|nr:acyl-CoA synthetase [Acidimicrobiales bacterium]